MFKFVAVLACVAVATASPDPAHFTYPLAYSAGYAPAVTTYSAAGPIYNPAPLVYSSPVAYPGHLGFAHLIKKRSVPVVSSYISAPVATSYAATYSAPWATTYAAGPLATTYSAPIATTYGAPLVHSSPLYTAAHFIKKRSAPLVVPAASYIAPTAYTAAAPFVSAYSTYPAASIYSSPYYSAAPLAYAQFIKK
ncbi:unnamed protein product [Leptosia nina]|uniref:Uncharacterized protein n=1 Tax=Leptosia nina TaxID=320188 RepID=A0AAV1K419_9NEOP